MLAAIVNKTASLIEGAAFIYIYAIQSMQERYRQTNWTVPPKQPERSEEPFLLTENNPYAYPVVSPALQAFGAEYKSPQEPGADSLGYAFTQLVQAVPFQVQV